MLDTYLLMEAFATVLAHPRLEAVMNSNVRVERRTAIERFAARTALVRLLFSVNDLVATQRRRLVVNSERQDDRRH